MSSKDALNNPSCSLIVLTQSRHRDCSEQWKVTLLHRQQCCLVLSM